MGIRRQVDEKKGFRKGSFTIEASFLIPLILFMILNVLQIGILFLQESIERAPYEKLKDFKAVERFYTIQAWKDFMEDE